MDTSETYIKMMRRNGDLILAKWEEGFNEGDYIWDGKSVHILGHDYVGIRSYFERNGLGNSYNKLRIALYEPCSAVTFTAETPTTIEIKDGKYGIKALYNTIWLPRQDQLQEMISSNCGDLLHTQQSFLNRFRPGSVTEIADTMEKLWLCIVMNKYNKVWNGDDWE
jgi:hypothetical protein